MRHFNPNSHNRSVLGANCYGALQSHEHKGVALVWLSGLGVVPGTRAAGSMPVGSALEAANQCFAPSKEET